MINNTFTIEEINLIHCCQAKEHHALINELHKYMKSAEPDMAEIIDHTICKLSYTTSTQLREILEYPAENNH